jgi:transcriptional regulator with XRE-family HTH domain
MPPIRTITREQVRAARGFAGWSIKDLAKRAGASINTISRFENGGGGAQLETLIKIRDAFEEAGVDFPDEDTVSMKRLRGKAE